jgi:hypothetical protein
MTQKQQLVALADSLDQLKVFCEQLQAAIVDAHVKGLPQNWVYVDPFTTLDSLVSECCTLRKELAEDKARLDSGQISLLGAWYCEMNLRACIDKRMNDTEASAETPLR